MMRTASVIPTNLTSFRVSWPERIQAGDRPTIDNSSHAVESHKGPRETVALLDSSGGVAEHFFVGASRVPSGIGLVPSCRSAVGTGRSGSGSVAGRDVRASRSKGDTRRTVEWNPSSVLPFLVGSVPALSTALVLPSGVGTGPSPKGIGGTSAVEIAATDKVADFRNAFTRTSRESRKGEVVPVHTGRFTTPPVEAAEAHCRQLWVIAWKDGQLSADEDSLMCGCEAVVFETMKADATEEVRNAMSQRRGFESPQFDRRLRELRGKVVQFRQRMAEPDPTPAGPAAQQKAA